MFQTAHWRPRRTLLSALLAMVMLGSGVGFPGIRGSTVAAADPSSDIPGVVLPGPVAAGRLGGAIYDVVYRLTVAAGHVIVASLTGTAGTDFDLYLFDVTATTVLSNTGLVTKSVGSTSSESISAPSSRGGTYYLDLHGATDVEGDYRLTVQVVPDQTPPTVSIVLAAGRGSTNQLTVPVTLTASDDLSGVPEMALSGDGITFSAWEPFQRSATWTFLPGDGPRRLWAKVRNGVGLESAPASSIVTIDTQPPSAIAIVPAPGQTVVGLRPRFTIAFDEPIDPASWTDLGLIVQAATGQLVTGGYSYDPSTRIGTFVPSSSLIPGGVYLVTIGNVTDVAGNRTASTGSWTTVPLVPTSLSATIEPHTISLGSSTRIDAMLAGAPGGSMVEILAMLNPSTEFSPVMTLTTTQDGRVALDIIPGGNGQYRIVYDGAFGIAPAQVDVRILVRRSIALVGRSSSVVSRARVGASVNLVAAVGPAAAGVPVSFRLYRFDAARRAWVYAGSRGRNTDAAGRASYMWTPPSPGSWYVRASVASTAEFANNISPVYRWSVGR